MKQGKITNVHEEKGFFFIDRDYFCRSTSVTFKPTKDLEVEFEPAQGTDGRKQAKNVKAISVNNGILQDYYLLLDGGYFDHEGYLLEDLITKFPQKLAKKFQTDTNVNKSTQIRKYFDQIQNILGRYKTKKQFQFVKTELTIILALLNYAKTKGHISEEFLKFMSKNIELAKESETNFSNGFVIHLQSLICYYQN